MIDLHCHLLPAIDDGPEGLDEALRLARLAVANGITKSIMTPHIHPGRYQNARDNIAEATESFRDALAEHEIPLEVGYAAEVRIGPEILKMVADEAIPFLGEHEGYQVMLLELPHEGVPVGSENLIDWLLKRNIRPMIAHPERNKDVMRDLAKIHPFVERGCLLQLTAMSVANRFGDHARERAVEMLERDWVHVIATDAHNIAHRPPDLAAGRDAATRIVGEEKARALVEDNPRRLVESGEKLQNG